MKKIKKTLIGISVTPRTIEMADMFAEKFGYSSTSETFAAAVAFAFDKSFPDYVYNKPLTDKQLAMKQIADTQNMTDEEYLLQIIKGKLYAGKAWIRSSRGTDLSFPIVDVKLFDSQNDPMIATHKAIMDGTFIDGKGRTGSEMQIEALRFWDADAPVLKYDANRKPIFADENGELPNKKKLEPLGFDVADPDQDALDELMKAEQN